MKNKTQILIVEKEYVIEEELLCRLEELGYEVVKTVFDTKLALQYLTNKNIDIVLIDVSFKDDAHQLAEIIKNELQIPFIFLMPFSAKYNSEQLIETKPSAILIQPISLQQIQFSIEVAIHSSKEQDNSKKNSLDLLNRCLFFKKNKHFERVGFDEIFWLRAENNYTVIHTAKGDFIYSFVLKRFTERLPADQFMRVHRSYIINISKIEGFEGKMVIIDDQHIPIAKNCHKKIFNLLQTV